MCQKMVLYKRMMVLYIPYQNVKKKMRRVYIKFINLDLGLGGHSILAGEYDR
jgi:hypothetical protein